MLVIEKDGFLRHERRLLRSETWRVLDSLGIAVGLAWVSGALLVGGRERGLSFWETMAVGGIGPAPGVIDYLTGAVFASPTGSTSISRPRVPSGDSERLNAVGGYMSLPGFASR